MSRTLPAIRHLACIAFALFLGAWLPAGAQAPLAKQVAAPPSDILRGVVRLPDPASTPCGSAAAVMPARFELLAPGRFAAEWTFPVEQGGTLVLALVSPAAATWQLTGGPAGEPLAALEDAYAVERRIELAGDALPGWVVDRRDVHGVRAGTWRVRVEARDASPGWLLASANAGLRAEAWVTTQRLVAGSPIAVAARATGGDVASVLRAHAVFDVEGDVREVAMHDDGVHEDGAAGDGTFGAFVPEDLRGFVRASAELSGATRQGTAFRRSALVVFPVLEPRALLDGSVRASPLADERLELALGAHPLVPHARLHVSAEVWGLDAEGRPTPVCWLSKMLEPRAAGAIWELPLTLDLAWLESSGAGTPLELRAVRVQDPDSEVVFDAAARLAVDTELSRVARSAGTGVVTRAMLAAETAGQAPPPLGLMNKRALMLVHGYCSSGSVWPAVDFSVPKLEFLDPSANRTHDQFAQLIAQRAVAAQLTSFGIVGHSQGGPAALHLLTYYTSGLDLAFGGRRIQSVAAPYQGTPLASLGAFACGVNNDMTPSGAATWLAGIPSWARAEVFTWTTANSASACNAITGLFLTDPEDGTVEKMRAELPGGNNLGHIVGWCHTTGMSNPANYTDHARNLLMNAAAAR